MKKCLWLTLTVSFLISHKILASDTSGVSVMRLRSYWGWHLNGMIIFFR